MPPSSASVDINPMTIIVPAYLSPTPPSYSPTHYYSSSNPHPVPIFGNITMLPNGSLRALSSYRTYNLPEYQDGDTKINAGSLPVSSLFMVISHADAASVQENFVSTFTAALFRASGLHLAVRPSIPAFPFHNPPAHITFSKVPSHPPSHR